MKYWLIRNYYLIFRKSKIMKFSFNQKFKNGEIFHTDSTKIRHVGKNYFIKL